MKNDIQSILKDFYMIDPSLKDMEEDLKKLIQKLIEAKPEVQIDKQFVADLRQELMAEIPAKQSGWLSRLIFPFAGAVLVTSLVIALIISYMPGSEISLPTAQKIAPRTADTFEMEMPAEIPEDENMAVTDGEAPAPKMAVGTGRSEATAEEPMLEMATMGAEEAMPMLATTEAEPVFYRYTYNGEQIGLPEGSMSWQAITDYLANGASDSPAPENATIKGFEVGNPEIIVENSVTYLKFTVLPNPDSSIYPQEVLVPLN